MQYVSYQQRRFIRLLLLSLFGLFLAACSTAPSSADGATDQDIAYVAPVDISADMTQAELEAVYNGTALTFQPEAGFAILGFTQEQGQLSTLATVEANDDLISPELFEEEEAEALGWDAWAGGWDAWAGGWDAWAGGWDAWAGGVDAWAGGVEAPTLPKDNDAAFDAVGLAKAHALTTTYGKGIKVAVIDTGVDLEHPIFKGRLAPEAQWKDFVDGDNYPQDEMGRNAKRSALHGHGTAAAGIILQVAPGVEIMPLRVLKPNGKGKLSHVIKAIDWAVANDADVINLSLGARKDKRTLRRMVDYAASKSVHVIASSGNASRASIEYPSRYATSAQNEGYVLSVGSVSRFGTRSLFSNYGPAIEFLAPGEVIVSAFPGNRVAAFTGTSFAAPMVSGMVALGLEGGVQPLEAHLAKSATSVLGFHNGYGVPNVAAMLESVKGRN